MNRPLQTGLLIVLLTLGSLAATGQVPAKPQQSFLAVLKEGQSVGVKVADGGFEIRVLPDVPLSHKVVEVGDDYVVVEDVAGITQTSIPVYSIKAIIVIKVPAVK